MAQKTIYFAYGSNMVLRQMARRCPGSAMVGFAVLDGYRWLINERGVATIAASEGGCVHGVLWELTEEHVAVLDEYEGLEVGNYYRTEVEVLCESDRRTVMTYIDHRQSHGPPRPGYLEPIVDALADHRFPPEYVLELKDWLNGRSGRP